MITALETYFFLSSITFSDTATTNFKGKKIKDKEMEKVSQINLHNKSRKFAHLSRQINDKNLRKDGEGGCSKSLAWLFVRV
jgi:hypothetical protein